nr:site-specific integrase [Microbacterium barkeri]
MTPKPYAEFRERGEDGLSKVTIRKRKKNPETGKREPTGETITVWRAKRYIRSEPAVREDGTRYSRPIYISGEGPDKATARKRLAENVAAYWRLSEEERLMPRASREMTLNTWYWEQWRPENEGRYKAADGFAAVSNRIEQHILPALGAMPLRSIKRSHIRTFVQKNLAEKNLKPNTIITIRTSLSTLLNDALEAERIPENPMRGMRWHEKPTKRFINIPAGFMDAFRDSVRGTQEDCRWTLVFLLGLRPGEALALTWDCLHGVLDGDDRKPTVVVQQEMKRMTPPHGPGCRRNPNGKGWACGKYGGRNCTFHETPPEAGYLGIFKGTKSSRVRLIPLPELLVELFREQRKRQERWRSENREAWEAQNAARPDLADLVFTSERGAPRRQQDDSKILKGLLERVAERTDGRVDIRFPPHFGRHIAITNMALAGIHQQALGQIVGHVDAATTAWYSQLQAEDSRGHIERIGKQTMDALRTLDDRRAQDIDEYLWGARPEDADPDVF